MTDELIRTEMYRTYSPEEQEAFVYAIFEMLPYVTEPILRKALNQTIYLPLNPNLLHAQYKQVANFADSYKIREEIGSVVNHDAVISALMQLFSPDLWQTVYAGIEQENTDIMQAIVKNSMQKDMRTLALHLSRNSMITEGVALTQFAQGAMLGQDYTRFIGEHAFVRGSTQAVEQYIALPGLERPVSNEDELLVRLQGLFPHGKPTPTSAIMLLSRNDAFKRNDPFSGLVRRECPAPRETTILFSQFGSLIRTDQYRQHFLSAVSPR